MYWLKKINDVLLKFQLHPEVKKNGVRFVCFCPAFTDTDILKSQPISTIDKELYQQALNELGIMRYAGYFA